MILKLFVDGSFEVFVIKTDDNALGTKLHTIQATTALLANTMSIVWTNKENIFIQVQSHNYRIQTIRQEITSKSRATITASKLLVLFNSIVFVSVDITEQQEDFGRI